MTSHVQETGKIMAMTIITILSQATLGLGETYQTQESHDYYPNKPYRAHKYESKEVV